VNRIDNYFVFRGLDGLFVHQAPVTVAAETAKKLLEKQSKQSFATPFHVCLDADSGLIYLPNSYDFLEEDRDALLQAAKVKILKEQGDVTNRPPIEGSPFSSLRIRSVKKFANISSIIEKTLSKEIVDLPVIEANLDRMPALKKILPAAYREQSDFVGGYIGKDIAKSISFVDEIDNGGRLRKQSIHLLDQPTPFILINVSPTTDPNVVEKEWAVLSGYRDYLGEQEAEFLDEMGNFADLYAIKRHLYMGWPFEEVCSLLLDKAANFGELINGIRFIGDVVESMEKDGQPNPSDIPYYLSFKVDPKDFPLKFDHLYDENGDPVQEAFSTQYKNFMVCHYDHATSTILLQSSAFISPKICDLILNAQSRPLIVKYNPEDDVIDVKSEDASYRTANTITLQQIRFMYVKIFGCDFDIKYRMTHGTYDSVATDPRLFVKRKLSEYHYACDFIRYMCDKCGVEFKDFDVVVGPIEELFGRGVQGGFMGKMQFAQSGIKSPLKVTEGVSVEPPVIFINSMTMTSYADQTDTLVHEYRHYIYGLQNPFYKNRYNEVKDTNGDNYYKRWYLYFTDPNEQAAHMEQIRYDLAAGQSVDEIIRDKVGGEITLDNYQVAMKFREIVQAAMEEKQNEGTY
jgi:hypothetical protein